MSVNFIIGFPGETIEEIDELNTTLHQAIFKYDKKDVSYVIAIARIIEKLIYLGLLLYKYKKINPEKKRYLVCILGFY